MSLHNSAIGMLFAFACASGEARAPVGGARAPSSPNPDADNFREERAALVQKLRKRALRDEPVLKAIGQIPRHELVPPNQRSRAYEDRPLPIGEGQTISQPAVVAVMTSQARVRPNDRVLEVGTGSGYQAAVLGLLVKEVFTIEIVENLGHRARADLQRLGLAKNIRFRIGDGHAGWPEAAPFDAIIVTAAPAELPPALLAQLKVGGRLVIPVGTSKQELRVITKTPEGLVDHVISPIRFVPMTGGAQGGN